VEAEVILVDFQDVGIRLYTFIWTLFDVMQAAAGLGKASPTVVVLDRPNPIGGVVVEGPVLNVTCCSSRYGKWPLAHRHGMTTGEMALMFNHEAFGGNMYVKVFSMLGWTRGMLWQETGLPWISPSPNLPTPESTVAYAQTVFIEATTLSEGRGTCTPFSIFGAPFVNATGFADSLNEAVGAKGSNMFRAAYFTPTFFKFNSTVCAGVQSVRMGKPNDAPSTCEAHEQPCAADSQKTLSLFDVSLNVLTVIKSLYPSHFAWDGHWFGVPGPRLVDLYAGTPKMREYLDAGRTPSDITKAFAPDVRKFEQRRQAFLLYDSVAHPNGGIVDV